MRGRYPDQRLTQPLLLPRCRRAVHIAVSCHLTRKADRSDLRDSPIGRHAPAGRRLHPQQVYVQLKIVRAFAFRAAREHFRVIY
jgi:hypothetical protein